MNVASNILLSLLLSLSLSLLVCYKASSPELMTVARRPALFIRAAQRLQTFDADVNVDADACHWQRNKEIERD